MNPFKNSLFTCKLKPSHIKNEWRIELILHQINNVSKNHLFSYWITHYWFSFWKHYFIFAIGGVLQQIKIKFFEAEIKMWFLWGGWGVKSNSWYIIEGNMMIFSYPYSPWVVSIWHPPPFSLYVRHGFLGEIGLRPYIIGWYIKE